MNKKEFYSIGEISKLCAIPVKTIRYYDEIGLLKPTYVASDTGYRYYSLEKALTIMTIKEYKSLGCSLENIKQLSEQEDLLPLIDEMEKQLNSVNQEIKELVFRKNKIGKVLQQIRTYSIKPEKSIMNTNNHEFEIKEIPKYKVMYIRYKGVHNQNNFILRFSQLINLVNQNNVYSSGPLMAIFHDHYKEYDYNNADIEVCVPIVGDFDNCSNVKEYGGFTAVTGIHFGPYEYLIESYTKAIDFIENNKYEYLVPTTERYIIDAGHTSIEEKFVTEFILPVRSLDSPVSGDIIM